MSVAPFPTLVRFRPASARREAAKARGLSAIPAGAKILWVSSTGGHLAELGLLEGRLMPSPDSVWTTFDTTQSRGFLQGRRHLFVEHVAPRDLGAALRAAAQVARLLRREKFDACVSTGAAVAGTVLPLAAAAGIPTYYVESLARPHGPSTTGRLLARVPGVRTSTQYASWSSPRWHYEGNSLDDWTTRPVRALEGPLNVLVTLGTIAPYRFDRAVDAVLRVLRPDDTVTWQLGCTRRVGLPGLVLDQVAPDRMGDLVSRSDVVVSHGGVGSIVQQLELGKRPVLAVRSSQHGEHVDDHQNGIAEMTLERGLATLLDLERPSRSTLTAAAACQVHRSSPQAMAAAA